MAKGQECSWHGGSRWFWQSVSARQCEFAPPLENACILVLMPQILFLVAFFGKVLAAEYCRTHAIPYLGLCLGFQAMVVDFARNVLKKHNANSTEFDEDSPHPVVIFMPEIDKALKVRDRCEQ